MLYFDTSALIAVYTYRDETGEMDQLLGSEMTPIVIWSFTEVEFESALQQLVRTKELTQMTRMDIQTLFQTDKHLGRVLVQSVLDVSKIHEIAKMIIGKPNFSERALDAIHVASALIFEASTFISLDVKQRSMAKREGLAVYPIKVKGEK